MIDDRQTSMRIDRGIAMTGKMFCGSNDMLALNAVDESRTEFRDRLRIFTVGTDIDDGIASVVIDIEDRCKNVLDADSFRLAARDLADTSRVVRISRRADSHRTGEIGCVIKMHSNLGSGVQRYQHLHHGHVMTVHDHHASHVDRRADKY